MSEQSMAIRQAIGVERLAEHLYRSGYWSDARSQSQAIVKVLRGAELNIGPISSMDGVYVIEGKTSLNATLLGSLIQRSERYRYRVVEHDDEHCVIDFYEIVDGKREKLGTSKFDMEDARKANLLGKRGQMWEKYPRNMLLSRALSNGARWYTPDIFNGPVYTPDELGAELDSEGNVVEVPYTPTREQEVLDATPRRIVSEDDRVWKRWLEVRSEALRLGIVPPNLSLANGGMAYEQLVSIATMLKAQVEDKQEQLDREEAARAAARAEQEAAPSESQSSDEADASSPAPQAALPASSQLAGAWARNRELMADAFAAGYKLRDLPNTTPLDEVEVRNSELEQLLETHSGRQAN